MANPYLGHHDQDAGYYEFMPRSRGGQQERAQTKPAGEAQQYYDENQSFDSEVATDASQQGRQKKHYRKHKTQRASISQHHAHAPSVGGRSHQRSRSSIKPGLLGTLEGFRDLSHQKAHLHDATSARLELLTRADRFFNHGFIGKFGGLNKGRTALFRGEAERVEQVMCNTPKREPTGGTRKVRIKKG